MLGAGTPHGLVGRPASVERRQLSRTQWTRSLPQGRGGGAQTRSRSPGRPPCGTGSSGAAAGTKEPRDNPLKASTPGRASGSPRDIPKGSPERDGLQGPTASPCLGPREAVWGIGRRQTGTNGQPPRPVKAGSGAARGDSWMRAARFPPHGEPWPDGPTARLLGRATSLQHRPPRIQHREPSNEHRASSNPPTLDLGLLDLGLPSGRCTLGSWTGSAPEHPASSIEHRASSTEPSSLGVRACSGPRRRTRATSKMLVATSVAASFQLAAPTAAQRKFNGYEGREVIRSEEVGGYSASALRSRFWTVSACASVILPS